MHVHVGQGKQVSQGYEKGSRGPSSVNRNGMKGTKMKVLVIDGNPKIAQVLSSYMKLLGYDADEAIDGREVIRQLQNTHYDIVITDSEITSIDGPEICKFIKSHYQNIYVIGISGYLSALTDLADAGADFCLAKPFCLNELKKAIEHRHSSNPS
jgi:CheY-like chemotaxis protein